PPSGEGTGRRDSPLHGLASKTNREALDGRVVQGRQPLPARRAETGSSDFWGTASSLDRADCRLVVSPCQTVIRNLAPRLSLSAIVPDSAVGWRPLRRTVL